MIEKQLLDYAPTHTVALCDSADAMLASLKALTRLIKFADGIHQVRSSGALATAYYVIATAEGQEPADDSEMPLGPVPARGIQR